MSFCQICPPILPCGSGCPFTCPPMPRHCFSSCCYPPCPCTPYPPCNCRATYRPCREPMKPYIVPPIVPTFPECTPRRCLPCEPPPPPPPAPVCVMPALPCCPPPAPCDPPPIKPCPEPVMCFQPVLPCCNLPQCPPPILPKQRPICPRAPPCPPPCLPVTRSCCPPCELDSTKDPITRRRPLIVHDGVRSVKKVKNVRQRPSLAYCCAYAVPVPLR